jgi:RNA polymerase sigma-70 factor (ECF subfamily)
MEEPFRDSFVKLFDAQFHRLFRYMNRLSGDPELAADLAQEAFIRLYRRGSLPDAPEAWLVTVSMNLFRNARSTRARRRRLLTTGRAEAIMSDPPTPPGESGLTTQSSERARAALERVPERERQMLLLRAEGHSYRDIAIALGLNEGSIGTLLARAKRAFREAYEADLGAS